MAKKTTELFDYQTFYKRRYKLQKGEQEHDH